MTERKVQDYHEFRKSLEGQEYMDRRNLLIALISSGNTDIASLITDACETLHLPPLGRSLIAGNEEDFPSNLKNRLESFPSHGYVLSDLFRTEEEVRVVLEWSKYTNLPLHAFTVAKAKERNADSLVDMIKKEGGVIHNLYPAINMKEATRSFFKEISPLCFEDKELAAKYYQFRDLCDKLGIPYILISGACSYIYWGRRPLKDLDIIVPSMDDLRKIGAEIGNPIEHLVSAYADTHYLNFSSGVEVVSDLSVLYLSSGETKKSPFTFEELSSDARRVKFFGENCNIMSPETLLLFKFGLGRFGIDQWGHHKDDYEDARGVLISQSVNLDSLRERAKKMGILERLTLGEQILGLNSK